MILDIFNAIKESDIFLSCNIYGGTTISGLTQSGAWVKIESRGHEFGIYEKEGDAWDLVHYGTADEIIDYINDDEEVDND